MISRILKSLFENENIKNLSLDISRNALGPSGISTISPILKIGTLNAFDLSDNGIKEKGAIEVLKSIKSVQRLILDRNWGGKEEKEADDLGVALGSFLTSHPEIYHLSVAGSSGSKLGRALKFLFLDLRNHTSLEELDFSGNGVGDTIFSIFCSAIAANQHNLKVLRCDNNGITYGGYVALKRAIEKSPRLIEIDFPTIDFEADTRTRRIFLEVLLEITRGLSKNKGNAESPVARPNVFDFDLKWKTPQGVVPLLTVPPELQAISSKLYDGALPVLPQEEAIEVPCKSTIGNSNKD